MSRLTVYFPCIYDTQKFISDKFTCAYHITNPKKDNFSEPKSQGFGRLRTEATDRKLMQSKLIANINYFEMILSE